jgi:sensor c-di-GMP phosphodiesterase-like protein
VGILAELGSVVGQGWYYARPMDAGQLVDWLRDRGDHAVCRRQIGDRRPQEAASI